MADDRRLIEDFLPVNSVGEAASSEPRTKGHISTLQVWRARRPLVACRAAVYGALVPASLFIPENGPDLPVPQSEATRQAGGKAAPLVDVLLRILWLVEHEPRNLNSFLDEARPDRERLRLVAQTLAGTALEGTGPPGSLSHHNNITTPAEAAVLKKLVANWRALVEARLSDVDLKSGQQKLFT